MLCRVDEHGMFWDVPLKGRADCQLVGLLVHQGETKAARGWEISWDVVS